VAHEYRRFTDVLKSVWPMVQHNVGISGPNLKSEGKDFYWTSQRF